MSPSPQSITDWTAQVSKHFSHLSKPQARVLAWWSFAAQALQSCGQSRVVAFLARLLGAKEDNLRQRLREWTWEKSAKKGAKRREVEVAACFAGLLSWVLSGLPAGERRLALALDATTLKADWVVLAISVVYSGRAIPIAWQVLPAGQPGAWQPHWLRLLQQVRGRIPADWCVLVLADRGLYADWLFSAIQAAGWHPFLRINHAGQCRPEGAREFQPLLSLVPADGQAWSGRVTCFKHKPLAATLLAQHNSQHADPWLILTDLAPGEAASSWYRLRAYIEAQFKDIKSGGWDWHYTRMTEPERVSRLWLVLAVALLYSISLGSQVEAEQPAPDLAALPATHIARRTATGRPRPRRLSLVSRGRIAFLVDLIQGHPLPPVHFQLPNPWPSPT